MRSLAAFTHSHYKLARRQLSTSTPRRADFTHAVIGGGAVGLAIARRLAAQPGTSTLLLERHGSVGTETSSRNSEVIHAGLYYGASTLKTHLCIQGREMLYAICLAHDIPHHNCGKWLVAQTDPQRGELDKIHVFAASIGVPTHFISAADAARREPDVRAAAGALESPTTGILDSHAYMAFLEGDLQARGGEVAFGSRVSRIEALGTPAGASGWRLWTEGAGEEEFVTAETLVNSAGLAAVGISNMILPRERQRTPVFAKGNYYSYGASWPKPRVLVYPAPVPGHGGLGTHLTLDMGGRVRFGPDVQYVDDPEDYSVSDAGLAAALDDIVTYLPGLDRDAVALDYSGIRPKLGKSSALHGKSFMDFYIEKEEGFMGFVNLLGIESPGLTSSLAIAEHVHRLLYR